MEIKSLALAPLIAIQYTAVLLTDSTVGQAKNLYRYLVGPATNDRNEIVHHSFAKRFFSAIAATVGTIAFIATGIGLVILIGKTLKDRKIQAEQEKEQARIRAEVEARKNILKRAYNTTKDGISSAAKTVWSHCPSKANLTSRTAMYTVGTAALAGLSYALYRHFTGEGISLGLFNTDPIKESAKEAGKASEEAVVKGAEDVAEAIAQTIKEGASDAKESVKAATEAVTTATATETPVVAAKVAQTGTGILRAIASTVSKATTTTTTTAKTVAA